MSLRYRLFLWVSGLFIVVSICAYFIENYVTQHELTRAKLALRQEILAGSEKRRVDLQDFLTSSIVDKMVAIDAVLSNISTFSPEALRFGPTSRNAKRGTWGDAVDLLLEDKWIDFIQNTNQGQMTATLMPQPGVMELSLHAAIDEDLAWAFMGEDSKPYFAVRVPYSLIVQPSAGMGEELLEQVPGVVPAAYVLFDPKEMMDTSKIDGQPIFSGEGEEMFSPIAVKWTEGYELDIEPFVKAFRRGRELLLSKKIEPPSYSAQQIKQKRDADGQQSGLNGIPMGLLSLPLSNDALMQKKIDDTALRYTQIDMIWVLVSLFERGLFGSDLFTFPSPCAVSVYSKTSEVGSSLRTKSVLLPQAIFEDSAYYQGNPPKDPHSSLATSLAVIPSKPSRQIFFGNTTELRVKTPGEERVGYLTLGVDADSLVEKLALAIHQTAALIYEDHLYSVFGEGGERIDQISSFPAAEMKGNSGIVSWNAENYFYVRIQPFPHVKLYFFLLNLESKEFALLDDLDAGTERVIDTIRLNTHLSGVVALLIAILVLHNIARNITRPIVQLARATKDVAEGNLDKVKLSLPPLKHKDEIAVLCHSFEEMVIGLKEKEKVKGVLSKVVSQEIATEILKGSVHLGGEEKKVTVLFADIRGFTSMTQAMPPKKVIELLNTCMTKISQSIDENKGVIDKYVGDEAMALFGAPLQGEEDAFRAIKSALEMIAAIKLWNEERRSKGEPPIEIGVGIHTGKMLAGNMGAENRLNYTVIGRNVNLASRVCSAAKKMEILITKDTLDEPFVKERIIGEMHLPIQLKGFDDSVELFAVTGIKK